MNEAILQRLTERLWPDGDHLQGPQVYWLLDGARDPDIHALVRSSRLENTCLYSGLLHPRLQAAAPYLVHLAANSPNTNLLLERGWGSGWGIFAIAPAHVSMMQLRVHFKKLLRVQTEDGVPLLFRYFDPAVLNVYMPTCTDAEFSTILGPAMTLAAEDEAGARMQLFAHDGTGMHLISVEINGHLAAVEG